MDIEKDSNREAFEAIPRNARLLRGAKFQDGEYVALSLFDESSKELAAQLNYGWAMWLSAKAQAVPEWISVEGKLPETEPNTDGVVCAVVCSLGNVYRARYMHDVDVGVDTKYWSEFTVGYNGKEHEHYEINAKITHWMPLPDAPREPTND